MADFSRTFRVFVSSTFADLAAERDALHAVVFPQLQKLCQDAGCRFSAVDLRWGVSAETALHQQAMTICLDEIRRCQKLSPKPNFIALVGNRRGWLPLPSEIPETEFQAFDQLLDQYEQGLLRDWYRRDDNAAPAVYWLHPRSGVMSHYSVWAAQVERPLHAAMADVARRAFPADRQWPYLASATEQEILHGALGVSDAPEHVFGFFRDLQLPSGVPLILDPPDDQGLERYLDMKVEHERRQPDRAAWYATEDLKDRLETAVTRLNVRRYPATWEDGRVSLDHLDRFSAEVLSLLTGVIREQIRELKDVDPLQQEVGAHKAFGRVRSRSVVGRSAELRRLREYADGDAVAPLAIYGESGSGKTALLAEFAADRRTLTEFIVERYVGATAASTNLRSLLASICKEIAQAYGNAAKEPQDLQDATTEFSRCLSMATVDRQLLVVLDALDQLRLADGATHLSWLPPYLPPHAQVIVSALRSDGPAGAWSRGLEALLPPENRIEVRALSSEESERVLDRRLSLTGRRLTGDQRAVAAEAVRSNGLPLYIQLVFELVRGWRSDSGVPHRIDGSKGIPPDVPALLDEMLLGLEQEHAHGPELTERSLGYLAASRGGLAEDELLDLLSRDEAVMTAFRRRSPDSPPTDRLPPVVWARLVAELEPYLSDRQSRSGVRLLGFYHRQVEERVGDRYLKGGLGPESHARMAEYFREQADPNRHGSWTDGDARALTELPFHLSRSGESLEGVLRRLLADLQYLDQRCSRTNLSELMDDFSLRGLAEDAASREMLDFLRRNSSSLRQRPQMLFSLVMAEGPRQAVDQGCTLVREERWQQPWLSFRDVALADERDAHHKAPSDGRSLSLLRLTVLERMPLEASRTGDLSASRNLVFRLKLLGEVTIIDMARQEELAFVISIRPLRPDGLFVSDDARFLAVAFANGEMDILEILADDAGRPTAAKVVSQRTYLRPAMHPPAMLWRGEELVFQRHDGAIVVQHAVRDENRMVPMPESCRGELAAIAPAADGLALIVRRPGQATLVRSGADGARVLTQRRTPGGVLCGGDGFIAVGWADHTLGIYHQSGAEQALLQIQGRVQRMAWEADQLVWLSDRGEAFAWSAKSGPTHLQGEQALFDPGVHVSVWHLAHVAERTFALATDRLAATFRVDPSEDRGKLLDLIDRAERGLLATQARDDGLWLLDVFPSASRDTDPSDVRRRSLRLTDVRQSHRTPLGTTDKFALLAAGGDAGALIDLEAMSLRRVPGLPVGIASVATESEGDDFWMTDRHGRILRTTVGGYCERAEEVALEQPAGGDLAASRTHVVWFGSCFTSSYDGESLTQAVVFFERAQRSLRRIGHRTYALHDGRVEAWDLDRSSNRVVAALAKGSRKSIALRWGRVDEFLASVEHEDLSALSAYAGPVAEVRLISGRDEAVVLFRDGAIAWVVLSQAGEAHVAASIRPSMPIARLARGRNAQGALFLAMGTNRIVRCELEGRQWR